MSAVQVDTKCLCYCSFCATGKGQLHLCCEWN